MGQEPYVSDPARQRTPEDIRREIGGTRANLDVTLDELEDRVSPTRIRQRQTAKARGRWQRMRDSVMGSADEPGQRAAGAGETVRSAPAAVTRQTRGNPLAAALVAFGAGALAGSLLPSSAPERQATRGLRDRFEEPMKDQTRQVGQAMKEDVQTSAQHAVGETKQTAQEAVEQTRENARQSVERVRDQQGGGDASPGSS